MDAVSEIKSRLNIEDVVSEYIQLKRSGRNYKGLSPFTNEKSPSFIVSPDKQIWHDFSSGKGGDVISFIEQVEGLDFKGSLQLLARKAGVDLESFKGTNSNNNAQKERLYQAVDTAVVFYQVQLTRNESALKYVRQTRGYDKQTLIDFRFGYSPAGFNVLAKYMAGKGFSEDELLKTGLCVKRNGEIIDMFRGRLMIPLGDAQGRPVGFTARILKTDNNAPKYINTPSTILYDKGRQLFGFANAKEHIRKSGYAVVVEGNLDVVASHQAGIKQVVASAGTALTSFHLKTLQRFTGDVRVAFDDDRAGQEAAERTIPIAQNVGVDMSIIKIPNGKDPDELIKQDLALWQKTVESPQYMVDWLIERATEETDLKTAIGKRQFTTKILEIIRHINDQVEQEHYIRIVAEMTNSSIESVNKKFTNGLAATQVRLKKPSINIQENTESSEELIREQHYLSIVLCVPDLRKRFKLIPIEVFSEKSQHFIDRTSHFSKVKKTDEYAKMLTLLFEETYQHTDHDELAYSSEQLAGRLIDSYIKNQKNIILKQLQTADEKEEKRLLTQVNELDKLKKSIFQKSTSA